MPIAVTPITPAVGAEISNVDLRSLNDAGFAQIEQAWNRHSVLLFRGQKLSDDDLLAFQPPLRRARPAAQPGARAPEPGRLSRYLRRLQRARRQGRADRRARRRRGGLAHRHELSPTCRPTPRCSTRWRSRRAAATPGSSSMQAAWAALPERAQGAARGTPHQARRHLQQRRLSCAKASRRPTIRTRRPGAWHPAVISHPVTGVPALYLGRRRNSYVEGLSPAESDALLDEVWTAATQPRVHLRAPLAGRRSGAVGQPLDHAPARSVRRSDAARHASHPDQGHAATARLRGRGLMRVDASAHILVGLTHRRKHQAGPSPRSVSGICRSSALLTNSTESIAAPSWVRNCSVASFIGGGRSPHQSIT